MQLPTVLEWPLTLHWAPSGLPLRFLQVSSSLGGGETHPYLYSNPSSFVKLPGGWSGPALLAREIFMPWIICFVNWIIIIIGTLAHANLLVLCKEATECGSQGWGWGDNGN